MHECEIQLAPARATTVQALIRELNGGVTPCERGVRCPVLPASGVSLGVTSKPKSGHEAA